MDTKNIILLALVAIIIIAPLVIYMGQGEEQGYFGGTDDAGGSKIAEMYHVVDSEGNNVSEADPDAGINVTVKDAAGIDIANGTTDDEGNVILDLPEIDKLSIETDDYKGDNASSAIVTTDNPNIMASITDDGKLNVTTLSNETQKTTYTLWFASLWEPPSGEIESLVFCLQAAIGAIIIGYIFGFWHGGNKAKKDE